MRYNGRLAERILVAKLEFPRQQMSINSIPSSLMRWLLSALLYVLYLEKSFSVCVELAPGRYSNRTVDDEGKLDYDVLARHGI